MTPRAAYTNTGKTALCYNACTSTQAYRETMHVTSCPCTWTATETLKHLRTNAITVDLYARSLLDRIDERDHVVKAWAYIGGLTHPPYTLKQTTYHAADRTSVLEQAQRLDTIPTAERGPPHGLAVGIKDVINTEGISTSTNSRRGTLIPVTNMPTQFGSRLYKDHQSKLDASCVSILRAGGALIFGRRHYTSVCSSSLNCR